MARALLAFDQAAFETAEDVFHDTYGRRRSRAAMLPSEREQAHAEALSEALEAFLGTYMESLSDC